MAVATKERIKLTQLKCGDQDNGAWYGSYRDNPDDAKAVVDMIASAPNGLDEIETIIFTDEITADKYRKILKVLTVYEECGKRTNNPDATAQRARLLFFATLVNYNGSLSKAVPGIKSFDAANEAAISAKHEGRELDYREYIISGEGTNWDNEYKTILTTNNDYSCKIQIKLPIIKKKFGIWKFATERIPGIMELVGDPDNTKLLIPSTIWMKMIEEAMGKRITTKFSKFEDKFLHKMIKIDANMIDDVLAQNNFAPVGHFVNAYEMEVNENYELVIHNTEEPPEMKSSSVSWTDCGHNDHILTSNEFYIVRMTGSTIYILQPR